MAGNVHEFTEENFEQEVLHSKIPVLVDFWAEWCSPCRQIAPIVDQLAQEFSGRVKIGKVNIDRVAELAGRYGIMSIPTLMIFKDGKPLETMVGLRSKGALVEKLEEL